MSVKPEAAGARARQADLSGTGDRAAGAVLAGELADVDRVVGQARAHGDASQLQSGFRVGELAVRDRRLAFGARVGQGAGKRALGLDMARQAPFAAHQQIPERLDFALRREIARASAGCGRWRCGTARRWPRPAGPGGPGWSGPGRCRAGRRASSGRPASSAFTVPSTVGSLVTPFSPGPGELGVERAGSAPGPGRCRLRLASNRPVKSWSSRSRPTLLRSALACSAVADLARVDLRPAAAHVGQGGERVPMRTEFQLGGLQGLEIGGAHPPAALETGGVVGTRRGQDALAGDPPSAVGGVAVGLAAVGHGRQRSVGGDVRGLDDQAAFRGSRRCWRWLSGWRARRRAHRR